MSNSKKLFVKAGTLILRKLDETYPNPINIKDVYIGFYKNIFSEDRKRKARILDEAFNNCRGLVDLANNPGNILALFNRAGINVRCHINRTINDGYFALKFLNKKGTHWSKNLLFTHS
tara:strand:- start:2807 stop:3160 length:354 start_codon:yes stop_codon:yes gene_type:complete